MSSAGSGPLFHLLLAQRMISISNLSKHYGNVIAVDDLSLSIEPGEVFGFIGPNGAGKTTTIRVLVGTQVAEPLLLLWSRPVAG